MELRKISKPARIIKLVPSLPAKMIFLILAKNFWKIEIERFYQDVI